MDLARFLQVVWRFKLLLGAGLVLATTIALLSFVRIGLDGGKPTFTPRENETWLTATTLLVTQKGFPWGRAILDEVVEAEGGDTAEGQEPVLIPRFSDPARYSGLAAIYAELAKGDAVQREVRKGGGPGEYYDTMVVAPPGTNASLPMIYIKGYGPTPEAAASVGQRASRAFIKYLDAQQAASGTAPDKRVEVIITQKATTPELFEKRSFVRPMFIFLLMNMVFLALAFALENLRPRAQPALRMRPASEPPGEPSARPPARAA
jgi:hypothetical protein